MDSTEDRKPRILLVEDDPVDRMAIERLFAREALPYDLVCAGTIAEALEMHREHAPALMLLDHGLPDGTGLELQAQLEGTPSVFITGKDDVATAIQAMKGGALDFLVKDTERTYAELLPVVIERALEVHRLREELGRHTEGLDELVAARTEELKESEERFRAAFEQAAVGMGHVGLDGQFVRVNDRLCELIGYERQELLTMSIHELTAPEDREATQELVEAVVSGEVGSYEQEKRYIRKGGGQVWVRLTVSAVWGGDGELAYLLGVVEDITEKRRTERDIRVIRDRLQLSIDRMPVAYILWNPSGTVTYWNPAAEQVFGFTREEAVGTGLTELLVSEEFRPAVAEVMDTLLAGGEASLSGPGINVRKDGTAVTCQWFNAPLLDGAGEVTQVLSMALDVTESHRTQEELRRSEVIVDSSTDMLALLDEDYRYLAVNPAYVKAFGKTRGEMVDHTAADLFGQEFFEAVIRPRADRCMGGEEVQYQDWFDFPDTGRRFMDIRYYPYRGVGGTVGGFVVSGRDVTELESARAKLHGMNVGLEDLIRERTEELVAANEELEAFAYSVSHDLKAPLRAIDGYSAMLQEQYEASLPEDGQRLLGVVRSNAKQMAQLIEDVLAISRIGRTELVRSDVDMRELAQAAFSELSRLEGDRAIEFSLGELPTLAGDSALLRQVWMNLLQNALKFTGGRETARIEIDCEEEPDHWVFRVRDNGAGFDMEYVDQLFGVFQRLHYAEEFPGTGVGLATVQRIIERHGGKVWAEGEVDVGATLFFRLPRSGE